ncbi:unnamed protein product [Brassicogethes aeneus]|uniref:Glycoprotein-N-acetylgalactosamine 3-beta-galactosyltransferase 1 n=1 Tax=Brassicogethes aeneus TaxID=1431903 RepID=A0A9P0FP22_BRAAE|nr:unnamed protein product [Brassicogethes aeneus]
MPLLSHETSASKQGILLLLTGLVAGFLFSFLFSFDPIEASYKITPHHEAVIHEHEDLELASGPEKALKFHEHHDEIDSTIAEELAEKVKVLCWVMTGPKNHEKKAKHVKATWGKRCNEILFMSSENDTNLPAVGLPVKDGRDNLWAKTKEAFKYLHNNNYTDKYDWFLKADDDTYVIVENLRLLLEPYSPNTPIYFGLKFKPYVKQGYMSGGAGYVLSKESVRRFVLEAIPNKKLCKQSNSGAEDVEIGKCLAAVNVTAGDSRDTDGSFRFLSFNPEHHLTHKKSEKFWYWQYVYDEQPMGINCCSDRAISFHYISPNQMYVMEYLIYHLRPYGIDQISRSQNTIPKS